MTRPSREQRELAEDLASLAWRAGQNVERYAAAIDAIASELAASRTAALEEAARVAEEPPWSIAGKEIADRIRALGGKG